MAIPDQEMTVLERGVGWLDSMGQRCTMVMLELDRRGNREVRCLTSTTVALNLSVFQAMQVFACWSVSRLGENLVLKPGSLSRRREARVAWKKCQALCFSSACSL